MQSIFKRNTRKKHGKAWWKEAGFCLVILVPAVVQWLILGLFPQFDSVGMAFQKYDAANDTFVWLGKGHAFDNFAKWFQLIFTDKQVGRYLLNGYLFAIIGIIEGFFSIFVTFVVARRLPLYRFFTNVMLLPSIIGGFAMLLIFQAFCNTGLPEIMRVWFGVENFPKLLSVNSKYALVTTLFWNFFIGFPGSLLMYVGMFRRIPEELYDYGRLEGLSLSGEFRVLGWPTLYPLWYLSNLGILTIGFSAMGPGYGLYGNYAYEYGVATWAYHLFIITRFGAPGDNPANNYCFSAASAIIQAAITLCGVLIMRKVLERGDKEIQF